MNNVFTRTLWLCCYTTILTASSNQGQTSQPSTPAILQGEQSGIITSSSFSRPNSVLARDPSTILSEHYYEDRDNSVVHQEEALSKKSSKLLLHDALKRSQRSQRIATQILEEQINKLDQQLSETKKQLSESEKKLYEAQHGWIRSVKNSAWFSAGMCTGTISTFTITSLLLTIGVFKGFITIDPPKFLSLFQVKK